MVSFNVISGGLWILCGVAILALAYLIAVRGRIDLHDSYDDSVDDRYAARRAGGTAVVMGLLVVGYGVREMLYGFNPTFLAGLVIALLGLSYISKRFAAGWGYRGG